MDDCPLSKCSDAQISTLDAFFQRVSDLGNWFDKRLALRFALVLTAAKPAFEFTTLEGEPTPTDDRDSFNISAELILLLDDLHLPHETHTGTYDGRTVVFHECGHHPEFSVPECEAPAGSEEYHRRWGDHYGYPESAIRGFIEDDCLRYIGYEEDMDELCSIAVEAEVADALQYIPLVSFVPSASERGLLDAIEKGQRYERVLRTRAETHGVQGLSKLVDGVMAENAEMFED